MAFFDPRQTAGPIGWIRYGRSIDRLDASINRIRLSILAGILGATLLAALAGVVLSRRAMRPISTLTTTAGEIARTRDPEVNLAEPEGEDEVAELTRTFSDMLHELSLSRAEEERLLMRQREFVADASHELRTPLTSVLANLELLEESLKRGRARRRRRVGRLRPALVPADAAPGRRPSDPRPDRRPPGRRSSSPATCPGSPPTPSPSSGR